MTEEMQYVYKDVATLVQEGKYAYGYWKLHGRITIFPLTQNHWWIEATKSTNAEDIGKVIARNAVDRYKTLSHNETVSYEAYWESIAAFARGFGEAAAEVNDSYVAMSIILNFRRLSELVQKEIEEVLRKAYPRG